MKKEEFTCCICGEVCLGYGNNPYPAQTWGKCCDKCNETVVIPMRIENFEKNGVK